MTRVTCPGCGGTVAHGLDAPSEMSWCGSTCAAKAGQPDRIVEALRQIEQQRAAQ